MSYDTLVFDTGMTIIGIFSVKKREYQAYYGDDRRKAAQRLVRAQEIVSYNGKRYDVMDISRALGLPERQRPSFKGVHRDMREIRWVNILGSNLRYTYSLHFPDAPSFPDTYEGSNQMDCYMAWKLWECWKEGGFPRECYSESSSLPIRPASLTRPVNRCRRP